MKKRRLLEVGILSGLTACACLAVCFVLLPEPARADREAMEEILQSSSMGTGSSGDQPADGEAAGEEGFWPDLFSSAGSGAQIQENEEEGDRESVPGQDMKSPSPAAGQPALLAEYEAVEERFEQIARKEEIEEANYAIVEGQVFQKNLESFGDEEVTFLPAFENQYHRMAVFVTDSGGNVLWKTDRLETNYSLRGELEQPNKGISAVSFQDMNRDGLTDIILITNCENDTGSSADTSYKVGDVLYQEDGSFYRDWRVSDQINRFGMNKSVDYIVASARDGYSTEFLYTATTLKELLDNGFEVIEEQHYKKNFEKLGILEIVPGVFSVAEYDVFMVYLVNEEGNIVWSFQPMGDYDSLFSMMGMLCLDLDGDGLKDLVIQARFSYEGPDGELIVDTKCLIYYQRTGGFETDTEFEKLYQFTEKDKLKEIVVKIRDFWGWEAEE